MERVAPVLVRIVTPHRAYGEYAAEAGAVRLRAVHYPQEAGPADLGIVLGTRAADGRELDALLLGDVAHPPGCQVEARPVGLLMIMDAGQSTTYVVAVAAADPARDGVTDAGMLARPWYERLEMFFTDATQVCWSDQEAAWALIHQARQVARLARAGALRAPASPAWRPDQAMAPTQDMAAPETTRHSRAEYAFYTLPLRFQKYVADYLMPLERVRFFVPRPRMLSAIERSLLRRKRLAEGILILTTEQLLFLEEVLLPDVTEMPHGYLVRGAPVERIVDVAMEERGGALVLGWATATDAGQEWLHIEFPAVRADELRELCERLAAYLPRPRDQRLQRVYAPETIAPDLRDPAANDPRDAEPTIARLTARRQEQLAPDEVALAQAFIPAWFEYGLDQAQLLLVTAERVLLLAETDPRLDRSYPLAQISSLELRASILGSWLALWMPELGTVRRVEIPFPSTGFGFQVCYRTLRQVLANAPELVREVM